MWWWWWCGGFKWDKFLIKKLWEKMICRAEWMVCPVGCVVFLKRTKKKFRRNKFLGLQQKKCAHRQGRDLTSCDLFYFSKKKIVFEKFFLFQAIFMSPKKKSAHRQGGGQLRSWKLHRVCFLKIFFHFKRSHLRQLTK